MQDHSGNETGNAGNLTAHLPHPLLALAERCEQAPAEQPGKLLEEAWETMAEHSASFRRFAQAFVSGFDNNAGKFGAALDAAAYESAALMLVPEEMRDEIEITTLYQIARVGINLNHGPDDGPFYGSNSCNSIALAVCCAALRALAAQPTKG